MGALPRLKLKVQNNYRKGSENKSINCECCINFVRKYDVIGIGGVKLGVESRCALFGLMPSRRYRVRPDHRCDQQKLDRGKCWWLK
jgi:hypothetical protein